MRLRFGEFELDRAGRRLLHAGVAVPLQPKVFDLLVHLVQNRVRVVTKDELLEALWGAEAVVPGVLTTAMGALRKALGEHARNPRGVIRTVPAVGYQFVAPITTRTSPTHASIAKALHQSFVGRTREIARFDAVLRDPQSPARLLYVHGPGGIGKTSVLQELRHVAGEHGMAVAHVDAEHVAARPEAFERAVAEAAFADPHLALHDALAEREIVVFIDNFDMLVGLSRWFREVLWPRMPDGVHFVVAARTAPDARWRSNAAWSASAVDLPLGPFDLDDTRSFLERRGIPEAMLESLYLFTSGHPLALAVAAEAVQRGADPRALPTHRGVIEALVETFTDRIPSARHRRALDAACLLSSFDEGLLGQLLQDADPSELYAWLSQLAFVTPLAAGLQVHRIVRESVLAQLRMRSPERIGQLAADCYKIHFDLLASTSSHAARVALTVRIMSLGQHNPALRPFYPPDQQTALELDIGAGADAHTAVVDIVRRHEGESAAHLADRWLGTDHALLGVVRNDLDEVVGFTLCLHLPARQIDDFLWDPAIEIVRDHLATRTDWTRDDRISIYRWLVARDGYQEVTPVIQRCHEVLNYDLHTMPKSVAYSFNVYGAPETWAVVNALANHQLLERTFQLGDRSFGVYAHSWREEPLEAWVHSIIAKLAAGGAT